MLDFTPVRNKSLTIDQLCADLGVDELRRLTHEMVDTMLALIANCTDAEVVFVPEDPQAEDTYAIDPSEVFLPWTLSHVIVHTTASSEESAFLAAGLARGVPYSEGRSRYEVPWRTVTTVEQCRQRLEESRRMRLASLNLWPDPPHLDNLFPTRSGARYNAIARFVLGLWHDDSHLAQIAEIVRQANEARERMNADREMSSIAIREAVEADFARIAQLISATQPEPVTESDVLEWEGRTLAGQIRRRMVTVSQTGQIDGYSLVQHIESMGEGRFYLWVTVDPTRRHSGIGAGAYDEALAFALAQGATLLESEVREECDEGLGFAARRGFAVNRHLFESAIDLSSFDESLFAGLVEMVQAGGIRFLSLADVDMDPHYFRQLYDVNYRAVEDDPGSTGSYVSFENFQQILLDSSWFDPRGQIMALDAVTGEVVGLSAVGFFQHTNRAYNMITGIDRAYRGHKIAQALKLLTIRFAQARGAASIVTNNDSQNAPMLAINRKLGYAPRPGILRLVKQIAPNARPLPGE
ncbi:MAG TPA: GNAT family N-acetyltransferase [Anaerolineae bacterium]|nr:GNAT family N-acetyltransferase [Anaerolineae bacterium]